MKMRLLITALTVMFLAACSSTKVITDYNPRANFSGYQQFVWADTSGGDKQVSPIAIDNVQTAFAEQLKNGLYKPAAKPDQADFIARYYVAEAAENDAANFSNRAPYPIFHLLREDSVERVLATYPDPENIPERNIAKLRGMSREKLRGLFPHVFKP